VLYPEASEEGLQRALEEFDALEARVQPRELQGWAAQFNEARFQEKMRRILDAPAAVPCGQSR
jgi:hypothetical protein